MDFLTRVYLSSRLLITGTSVVFVIVPANKQTFGINNMTTQVIKLTMRKSTEHYMQSKCFGVKLYMIDLILCAVCLHYLW